MREQSIPLPVGSTTSFEAFYENEYHSVVGLAYALSGSLTIAEDLAQDAFLAAHRNWDRVARYEHPDAWVRRVVANLSVSVFRRGMAEAKALVRMAEPEALPAMADEDGEFWRAVRSLPRRQAQVVALHYLEDRPIAEIAAILSMAPGTVKKHLFDGRRSMAAALGIEGDET